MTAHHIPIGQPTSDTERQALRFLVDGLPQGFTVYGNPWLVERSGAVYPMGAIVVAPHAVFVIDIKSYRGRIGGTDLDWYVPYPTPSPLKQVRITAEVLRSQLKRENYQAGQVWAEGLVFLSATTDVAVKGPASQERVHTKKTILAALQDPALVDRLSGGRATMPSSAAEQDLLGLLTAAQSGPKPVPRVREYEILETLEQHETFTELLARNTLSSTERVLRMYTIPPTATEDQRERVIQRARWESQVLGRLGRNEGILSADPPFSEEGAIVLPLESFRGITLPTWLSSYGPEAQSKQKADLRARTDVWLRIAQTMDEAHKQGVVHRLLRPQAILVEDLPNPRHIRVTGFDLAKQLSTETSFVLTSVADDRLVNAAPEVVNAFSSAEPASDQFSLGAILALLLTGKPLFETTRQYMAARRLVRRVRDVAPSIGLRLDEAVTRMVQLRPTDRFPTLEEAMRVVRTGRETESRPLPGILPERRAPLDADNLERGTRIGTDYEIVSRLGQGGMAVVYEAHHLPTGRTRALKIARTEDAAEEALRGEYEVLRKLQEPTSHPNIVQAIDLTKMVDGRLTLAMERVSGKTLRGWLGDHPTPEPPMQRRLAEDLLAGLDYLEQRAVTHKDLKPDNLLVSDGRLVIIDFSLAKMSEDAPYGGTALYRDPASARWSHATDRFAAALCLFELYAGRHAFDGRVPEPGDRPSVRDEDIDPPGLAAFFQKALHPIPEQRFPSARVMREALLVVLGDERKTSPSLPPPAQIDATTPLRLTNLSRRAVNALARGQVHTVGEALSLSAEQVRKIHEIGKKTASDIITFQETVRDLGIAPTSIGPMRPEPSLVKEIVDSPEPLSKLPLLASLRTALENAKLPTIGAVATLTRPQLLAVPGIGPSRLAQVVEALHRFRARSSAEPEGVHTLDRLWELASRPLSEPQRTAIERAIGLTGEPEMQGDIAEEMGRSAPTISIGVSSGLERLDTSVLADASSALDLWLDGFGGVVRLDDLGARFEEDWPAGLISGQGIVRLLTRISLGRAHLIDIGASDVPLVARPTFDRETLRAFAEEVAHVAHQWPPIEPEAARRTLSALLPHFDGDPVALGVRLCDGVHIAETGHLFEGPLDAQLSISFVLGQAREPMKLEELEATVRRIFGQDTPYPDADHLMEVLRDLDCRVAGSEVIPGRSRSVVAAPPLPSDDLAIPHGQDRRPEEVVRDMLKDAAVSRGFRMLVTPPEHHAEIGRSIAPAIGATWVSFEDAFFTEHAAELPQLQRAERFVAQRDALTEAAEQTLFRLLDEHGEPGRAIVLGDTALFALCEALDLPRRLYDETLSGSRGFWVLVVPGVVHNRQPRFNEGPAMWHLEGATMPLLLPLPT